MIFVFPVKFSKLGVIGLSETAVPQTPRINQVIPTTIIQKKEKKKKKKEEVPFRSDVDDEKNLPLVNAKVNLLAGAILIPHAKRYKNSKEDYQKRFIFY